MPRINVNDGPIGADFATAETLDALAPGTVFSLEQFLALQSEGRQPPEPFAVQLSAQDDPERLAGHFERIAVIAVAFDAFADGRGFSTAALLRERYGFSGELRAVGSVIADQLGFLKRVGFDTVELDPRHMARAQAALEAIDVAYQPAADPSDPFIPAMVARRRAQSLPEGQP
ncbi:MAG: DUF934 domain-containing protein [Maricaulaceae bacterium]